MLLSVFPYLCRLIQYILHTCLSAKKEFLQDCRAYMRGGYMHVRQEGTYLAPERPAVGSRCVIPRRKGAFNSFPTRYFARKFVQRLGRDRAGKGAVADQKMLLRAVLRARGAMRMGRPYSTGMPAWIEKRTKQFGGDLVKLQYAALLSLHKLQRVQNSTESRARGLVRKLWYIPLRRIYPNANAVRNRSAMWRTPFPVLEHQ